MRIKYLLVFIILTTISCQNAEKKIEETNIDIIIEQQVYFDYSNTQLKNTYTDTLITNFSNNNDKDSFIVNLNSGNINKSKAVFRIKNFHNLIIYEKEFYVSDLVNGYDLISIKTDEQMESYIVDKAKSFLSTENFSFPSNLKESDGILLQSNQEDFRDYDTYLKCKTENRPVFSYGLNEENISFIGYSAKHNKVFEFLYCC